MAREREEAQRREQTRQQWEDVAGQDWYGAWQEYFDEAWREYHQRGGETYTAPPRQDDYALIGVPSSASRDEVKAAYRKKARENHPDLHPNEREKYTALMQEINAAYDRICQRNGWK
jgi:DnaJ-domain-containing protein 1